MIRPPFSTRFGTARAGAAVSLLAIAACFGPGCDAPAALYPVDPCRLGDAFDTLSAEVTCAAAGRTIEATFGWDEATRAGGVRGDGWDGLAYYSTGTTTGGGTFSVGHRPGAAGDAALGFYAIEGGRDVVVGFLPAGADLAPAPYVALEDADGTCDAATGTGSVSITGLPETWVDGGVWTMDFDAGAFSATPVAASWASPWPATCPLHPASWSTVRVAAACDGLQRASIQFLAPSSYTIELDALGQVATVAATWAGAFSASCDGGELPDLDGSLRGDDGDLRLYTPVLTVTRAPGGGWALEETVCGECDDWVVTVEGLPDL